MRGLLAQMSMSVYNYKLDGYPEKLTWVVNFCHDQIYQGLA
jgi:hypothetical protein